MNFTNLLPRVFGSREIATPEPIALPEKRASFENPNTPLSDPAAWLINLMGGGAESAGVHVSQETAMRLTAVWSAIRILGEAVASLPLLVYRRTDQGKERADDHPLMPLLHDEPNQQMTSFTFREMVESHAAGWGNGYAFIVRDPRGRPVALWPLMADQTRVVRNPETREPIYLVRREDGSEMPLLSDEVLHVPGPGFDGLVGKSPIAVHREAIGLGLAAQAFGSQFFANGASLSGVLEHPKALDDEAFRRLKKDWETTFQGVSNAHKTAILEQGTTYRQIGVAPDDAQFIETRKFQVTEIARIFRVPPYMLADLEQGTFNNNEQQSIDFLRNTLRPWLIRWEQELNRKLLLDSERQTHFIEFKIDAIMRGDSATRAKFYKDMWGIGVMSPNDIRDLENMNRIEGGEKYYVPVNFASTDDEDAEPVDEEQNSRALQMLRNAVTRCADLEIGRAQKLIKSCKGDKRMFCDKWSEWLDSEVDRLSEMLCIDLSDAAAYLERQKTTLGMAVMTENFEGIDEWQRTRNQELTILAGISGEANGR